MVTNTTVDPAAATFAAFAPYYERFARDYRHDKWMRGVQQLALAHGLRGRDVLDVGCGTGKSLGPLLEDGYRVVGCDLSPEMLDVARELHPGVELHEADMRCLPRIGSFSWITCMNDALNFMLEDGDLAATFTSMAELLRAGGLITFDINSPGGHRRSFEGTWVVRDRDTYMCWEGRGCHGDDPVIGVSDVVVFSREDDGWRRTDCPHRERLWSHDDVVAAAGAAGLEVAARYGQRPGCILEAEVDDGRHHKVVYVLRKRAGSSAG